jgi:hypothetical protein
MKARKIIFWVLAVVMALAAMVYQRMTGPTYPKDYAVEHAGERYTFSLPRSYGEKSDCPVELELPGSFEGRVVYRKFPTDHPWDTLPLYRTGGVLSTALPRQPAAGKLEYHLELFADCQRNDLGDTENVIIRFKDPVPNWALIPHVLLMVLTVIWSTAILFFALANMPDFRRYVGWTLIFLILGGFVMGPIVQKYSFGQFWTGWPLGEDLTDNKVLFALIAFLPAWFLRKKSYGRWLALFAALVMMAVYLIPHSMNGSELNYETGKVITGSLFTCLALNKQWRTT